MQKDELQMPSLRQFLRRISSFGVEIVKEDNKSTQS